MRCAVSSLTSLSCAISCVSTTSFSMSQMVHVVSMEHVPMRLVSFSFQSNDVSGAQYSLFCLLFSIAFSSTLSSVTCHSRR